MRPDGARDDFGRDVAAAVADLHSSCYYAATGIGNPVDVTDPERGEGKDRGVVQIGAPALPVGLGFEVAATMAAATMLAQMLVRIGSV